MNPEYNPRKQSDCIDMTARPSYREDVEGFVSDYENIPMSTASMVNDPDVLIRSNHIGAIQLCQGDDPSQISYYRYNPIL